MLKKIGLGLLALSPLSVCFASSGFYLGANTGIDSVVFRQQAIVDKPGTFHVFEKDLLGGEGALGDFYVGYGLQRTWLYLAGELNAIISSAQYNTRNVEFIHGSSSYSIYKINHSLGVSFIPGIVLSADTLFYGRVGYNSGSFHILTTDSSLANVNKQLSGLRLGLGL